MQTLPDIKPTQANPPSIRPAFAVDTVKFGDGYAQRRPAGINSVRQTWTVSWNHLRRPQYEQLWNFLLTHKGVAAFLWQPPWDSALRKWTCDDMSSDRPTAKDRGSIRATFVEDLNP